MLTQIQGLHHITSMASDAARNNVFFTNTLGLRRIKTSVNFDIPDVYHLYYGDETGTPGSVLTYFPFPNSKPGTPGTGEIGTVRFAIPKGAATAWASRLSNMGATNLNMTQMFGQITLCFSGPDGDLFALVETKDTRRPWANTVPDDMAIRGLHSATLLLDPRSTDAAQDLLAFMGYELSETDGDTTRHVLHKGGHANTIDVKRAPPTLGESGAGSVHHIAFSVKNRTHQKEVRDALTDAGYQVTPPIDRTYFWSTYFRIPGGILFEIATQEPGFDCDEDLANLGQTLMLPPQHEHLRARLERHLQPLAA